MRSELDVVIVGGGPAGLQAALTLGRARRRVLLADAGTPRNAAATHVHNFLTRDGTPPAELRRIARDQLAPYDTVELAAERVVAVTGELDRFDVALETRRVTARRILLCTGMIDELPELPGVRTLWGSAIFACPFCHGWEHRDEAFGVLALSPPLLDHALLFTGWSRDVVAFTDARYEVPFDARAGLARAGVSIEERPLRGLIARGDRLDAVELTDGTRVARDVLWMRPPQRQPDLITSLGLALDDHGCVRVDEHRQTSRPGILAAGDLTTMMQGALLAAAAGVAAAAMLTHDLVRATPPA